MIEETYKKLEQLEHILLRPDTYIGSVEHQTQQMWVMNRSNEDQFELRNISYVSGLYKIFDEILVNAADNYQRDKKMNCIKVKINRDLCQISVWNNGKGIPIAIHKEYDIYVPELIFGNLLTSSNYDDNMKKVTGGRNGYGKQFYYKKHTGAKLANIFSKYYKVETADVKVKKKFDMSWSKNMSTHTEANIVPYSGDDFTCITFEPDLKKFHMKNLDDDIVDLMEKRVYDLAGIIGGNVKIHLNGKPILIKGLSQYSDMYLSSMTMTQEIVKVIDNKGVNNERWEVIASMSDGQFQQVSFVNSISTSKGGTHVNYIVDQITSKLMEQINKKKEKGMNIKPFQVKQYLWVFINCQIENPSFDSQTKETLTLKKEKFGSTCEISDKFIKDLMKSDIINTIMSQAKAKDHQKMSKTLSGKKEKRLIGIPKLEDANEAGTKNAEKCTLILTEGDSAKSLAMAGLEIVGRDYYGVFPLKGKLLNVREATTKQITENNEIQSIIKSVGLQIGKKYDNVKQLRYGSIMIMADQDNDGSHIKGLFLNFIHAFWPSLFKIQGFIKEFVTPLIKAKKQNQSVSFFTQQDYMIWLDNQDNPQQWQIKYYKGLGTSTNKEAQEYFSDLNKHIIDFQYKDDLDDEAIDLAFNKKKADDRKDWLATYDPKTQVDHSVKKLRYKDFVHKELIQFSIADCARSIPSICDGLKHGQRKILYACFKRKLKQEIKVAQLSGYVAEHSAYHHGEQSLAMTIVNMAQNFVGSNNINYLLPIGQFGSRNLGGKDQASARYIHTSLHKLTRYLFNESDDHVLNYQEEDGQTIEPQWYLPILPAVLVNGCDGIGTGWSTSIPPYNPRQLVEQIQKRIDHYDFEEMYPYFRGFTGEIISTGKGGFVIKGKYKIIDNEYIEITELPIRKWTRDFKNFLEECMVAKDGAEPDIKDLREYHAGNRVHFVLQLSQNLMSHLKDDESVEKYFKLTTTCQTTNMVLFNPDGKIKKYNNISEILEEFYVWRLDLYEKRKQYLVSKIMRDIDILTNKKKFILAVINEDLSIRNLKKKVIIENLQKNGFKQMKDMTQIKSNTINENTEEKAEEISDNENETQTGVQYNYLLSMPLWNLTYEKVEQLKSQLQQKEQELELLQKTEAKQMWKQDLEEFIKILDQAEEAEEQENQQKQKQGNQKKGVKNVKQKKQLDSDDSEQDNQDENFSADKPVKKKQQQSKKNDQNMEIEQKMTKLEPVSVSSKIEKKKPPIKVNQENNRPEIKSKPKSEQSTAEKIPQEAATVSKKMDIEQPIKEMKSRFPGIQESILKYLIPMNNDQKLSSYKNENQTADYTMSLGERLRLKEMKGDTKVFTDSYKEHKLTPAKQETSIKDDDENSSNSFNKKRKNPIFDDNEDDKIQKDDFDSLSDYLQIQIDKNDTPEKKDTPKKKVTNSASKNNSKKDVKETKKNIKTQIKKELKSKQINIVSEESDDIITDSESAPKNKSKKVIKEIEKNVKPQIKKEQKQKKKIISEEESASDDIDFIAGIQKRKDNESENSLDGLDKNLIINSKRKRNNTMKYVESEDSLVSKKNDSDDSSRSDIDESHEKSNKKNGKKKTDKKNVKNSKNVRNSTDKKNNINSKKESFIVDSENDQSEDSVKNKKKSQPQGKQSQPQWKQIGNNQSNNNIKNNKIESDDISEEQDEYVF